MRFFYLLIILHFFHFNGDAQTIDVAAPCLAGISLLNRVDDEAGKPAYQGAGTVNGNEGTPISIFWMPAPDNVWVLAFDGQPYYQNACTSSAPQSTGNVSCPWTVVSETECGGITPLVILGTGVLPVELNGFTATLANKQVRLNWKTASETNNRGFEIQRSVDGVNWRKIGFVNGALNSSVEKNYQFTDEAPFAGKNQYVLIQYDLDNHSRRSALVQVDFSANGFYTLSNKPGNGIYQLTIQSSEQIEIAVLDLSGRKIFGKIAAQGVHKLDVSQYAPGIYVLQLKRGDKITTEKLIKR